MKSRIIQGVLLLIVFAIGCALFVNRDNNGATEDNGGYVPPSP